jgi:hypothetical protein
MGSLPAFTNDIKHPNMGTEKDEAMLIRTPPPRIARGILPVGLCVLVAFAYYFCGQGFGERSLPPRPMQNSLLDTWDQRNTDGVLVPLEAHIMSKCPDAQVSVAGFISIADSNMLVGLSQDDGSAYHAKGYGESKFHTLVHRHVSYQLISSSTPTRV